MQREDRRPRVPQESPSVSGLLAIVRTEARHPAARGQPLPRVSALDPELDASHKRTCPSVSTCGTVFTFLLECRAAAPLRRCAAAPRGPRGRAGAVEPWGTPFVKKLLILILVIAAVGGAMKKYRSERADALNPAEITSPVFAELRVLQTVNGRELEMVALAATADEADCRRIGEHLLSGILAARKATPNEQRSVKSHECKRELPARQQRLMDNKPSSQTYLSLGRGGPQERELRLIYWGISVEEANAICELAPSFRPLWTGPINCIRTHSV